MKDLHLWHVVGNLLHRNFFLFFFQVSVIYDSSTVITSRHCYFLFTLSLHSACVVIIMILFSGGKSRLIQMSERVQTHTTNLVAIKECQLKNCDHLNCFLKKRLIRMEDLIKQPCSVYAQTASFN